METEYGAGIKAIQRDFDPDFWPEDFAEYAEEEIIPEFVAKFLEGDMTWLRLACTGEVKLCSNFFNIQIPIYPDKFTLIPLSLHKFHSLDNFCELRM